MTPKAISEIVSEAIKLKTNEEKIAHLQKHKSDTLRVILRLMYNTEQIEFLIPNVPPPWKKNGYKDVEGMLYKESRRLGIFVKGMGYDNLNQVKRENLFISLLEDIDDNDAELLCKMIQQKPLKGLPKSVVVAAFPQDYPTQNNQENTTNA